MDDKKVSQKAIDEYKELETNATYYMAYEVLKAIIKELEKMELVGKRLLLTDLYQLQQKYFDECISRMTEEQKELIELIHKVAKDIKDNCNKFDFN